MCAGSEHDLINWNGGGDDVAIFRCPAIRYTFIESIISYIHAMLSELECH